MREMSEALLTEDPILGPTRGRKTLHSGAFRNVPGANPVDHPLFSVESSIQVNILELRNGDIGSFLTAVYDFSKRFHEEQTKHLFRILFDVTEAVGNVSQAEGRKLTAIDIIKMEESISIGYDEDGNPNPISIVAGTEAIKALKEIEWTSWDYILLEEMRRKKREAYHASKRSRRLRQSSK